MLWGMNGDIILRLMVGQVQSRTVPQKPRLYINILDYKVCLSNKFWYQLPGVGLNFTGWEHRLAKECPYFRHYLQVWGSPGHPPFLPADYKFKISTTLSGSIIH